MALSVKAKKDITKLIDDVVQSYIGKAKNQPKKGSGNPFTTTLLNDFEPLVHRIHGLRTALGSQLEKIAEIIAKDAWGADNVKRKTNRSVRLPANVFQTISDIVGSLTNKVSTSNYGEELERVKTAFAEASDVYEEQTYEFDLEINDPTNGRYYFLEMKGPDPNTTEVRGAKGRLLTEYAWGVSEKLAETIHTYFAIYYNNELPDEYKNPKVMYYFQSEGLLVHDAFWNFIGKDDQTFNQLIELFVQYGKDKKKEIRDAFAALIEPVADEL